MDLRALFRAILLLAVCWPPLDFLGTLPYGPCGAGAKACPPRLAAAFCIRFLAVRLPYCFIIVLVTATPPLITMYLIATPASGAAMSNHPSHFIDTHAASTNGHDNDANADSAQ